MTGTPNGRKELSPEYEFDIRFPALDSGLEQDEEFFEFNWKGERHRLRIHDYAPMYHIPGLYEALVYGKLKCNAPRRMADLVARVLSDWPDELRELRVLDLGAGNGIVGEELIRHGVGTIVGLDLLPEAAMAAKRDRPGVYRDYVVADLCNLDDARREQIEEHRLNCLLTVAALGFGDIPPAAFAAAFNLVTPTGWLGMTIKENFLERGGDDSGFARLMRSMIDEGIIEIQAHHRFCHRLSIAGEQLFYMAIVARKTADIPQGLIEDLNGEGAVEPGGSVDVGASDRNSDAACLILGGQ